MPNTKIVSLTAKFQMLMELCSRTSKTVVSSTYLAVIFQSLKSLFIIIENRVTSILVPWGMPPWVCFHYDKVLPIHTAWVLLVRKDFIQSDRVILVNPWKRFEKGGNQSKRQLGKEKSWIQGLAPKYSD